MTTTIKTTMTITTMKTTMTTTTMMTKPTMTQGAEERRKQREKNQLEALEERRKRAEEVDTITIITIITDIIIIIATIIIKLIIITIIVMISKSPNILSLTRWGAKRGKRTRPARKDLSKYLRNICQIVLETHLSKTHCKHTDQVVLEIKTIFDWPSGFMKTVVSVGINFLLL